MGKEMLLAVGGFTTRQRLTAVLSLIGGAVAIRSSVGPLCREQVGGGGRTRTSGVSSVTDLQSAPFAA